MRDLHNNVSAAVALTPRAIATDTTTSGTAVDLQGYEGVEFVVATGVLTDGAYVVNLQESDVSGSGYTDVAAADMLGTEPNFAATDDNVVGVVGYRGNKRYVRLQIVSTGTTTGGLIGAVAIRGRARHKGAATA
jgi:hypothetical protein